MDASITSEIVNFILRESSSPAQVKEKAVEHITDGVAVMLAGARTDCVKKLVELVQGSRCVASSTLVGFSFKSSSPDAALVNGTGGHVDDYDDTQLSSYPDRVYGLLTHPTVPVLASSLAVGESMECSGKSFLEAFITGFEVECKLAEAVKPEHYLSGFHTTGTIGVFGACAASAKLLELREEEVRYALGIAASMSSGIRANFGTMTKPLHAGMAASNGVMASMLAEKGFTSNRDALDGRWGFMNVVGHGYDPGKIIERLGCPYSLVSPGASIKIYPCASLAQPSMDVLLDILLEEDLKPGDVKEIRLRAGSNILDPLRYRHPSNSLQAKFSLQFSLASILVNRRASLKEYADEVVSSEVMRSAMAKVKTIFDKELEAMGKDKMRSIVEIELEGGRVIRRVAKTVRGTPVRPLKGLKLYEKFRGCAGFVLNESKIDEAFRAIRGVEELSSISELTYLLKA